MKQVLVESVFHVFEYVMQHYYPPGLEEFVILRQAAPISMYLIHWKPHGYEVFSAARVCRRSDLKQGMQQLI
ncbi:MAG TPA: hypothetical protein IAC33_10930 [Candidatus Fimousia stercorigallinarum]|nr:hypothetical protein [Candidatus Fimousia stercorigallinarum]